jgi:hypothetical protein
MTRIIELVAAGDSHKTAPHDPPPNCRAPQASALAQDHPADAEPVLRRLTGAPGTDATLRLRIATTLARVRPPYADELADALHEADAADVSAVVELFETWAVTDGRAFVDRLVAYLEFFTTRGWNLEYGPVFSGLANLLRRADPVRCAVAMESVLHGPLGSAWRHDAIDVWLRADRDPAVGHLVAIVEGRCPACAADDGHGREETALLRLARLRDPRTVVLAESFIERLRRDGDFSAPFVYLRAAEAIAQMDRARGAWLLAELGTDRRLSPAARMTVPLVLGIYDGDLAAQVARAFERDEEIATIRDNFHGAATLLARESVARDLLIERIRADAPEHRRADAVEKLLQSDPDTALRLLMRMTTHGGDEQRQWAIGQLRTALASLDLLLPEERQPASARSSAT